MKIRHGWSGEVAPSTWSKWDIELEEDDLRRLLRDNGLPAAQPLSVLQACSLLELEAEIMVRVKLVGRFGYPKDKGSEELRALREEKNRLVAAIKGAAG